MNVSDSERIEAVLQKCGLKSANEKSADLIVVNSCSVRQKPMDRIWGKLKVWSRINPRAKKILTGCVLPSDLKKMEQKFDYWFKIKDLGKFKEWLTPRSGVWPRQKSYLAPRNLDEKNKNCHSEAGLKNLARDPSSEPALSKANVTQDDSYFNIQPKYQDNRQGLVPIMTGCNNFCSYCVVPYTRGKEWSRDPDSIVKEIKCLVSKGHREILLLGQNVNSYLVKKSKKGGGFVELLKKLIIIPGDFEIKFMSPHPKDFSDGLIDLIAAEPKISKQVHLPLQSGDDQILKKMNRHYTTNQYLSLVDNLKNKIKDLEISTDIIVGFPRESKKAFQNTVKIAKKCHFNKAYISIYSPRPGTMAEQKYEDNIPMGEKKRRWRVLEKIINQNQESRIMN